MQTLSPLDNGSTISFFGIGKANESDHDDDRTGLYVYMSASQF